MKNKCLLIVLFAYTSSVNAGVMNLYDWTGKETGKIEGFVANQQLLIECYEFSDECTVKFGGNKFKASLNKHGVFNDTMTKPDYFKFNTKTGEVQGVTGEPYYYFIGTCKKR